MYIRYSVSYLMIFFFVVAVVFLFLEEGALPFYDSHYCNKHYICQPQQLQTISGMILSG